MTPDPDALLCARYPALLRQRSLPSEVSPLVWGFLCEDGWFLIVDQLFARLQAEADRGRIAQPILAQLKEKFGELRCHLDEGVCRRMIRLMDWAALRALRTCEKCGAAGVLYVRCKRHAIPGGTLERRSRHVP